jgi:hypothetical protein
MGFYLVPVDQHWLNDTRLRDVLVGNLKARIEEEIRSLNLTREFSKGTESIKVFEAGNAVVVEIRDGKGAALEKGVAPHQMTQLEGSTVPIKTAQGTIFRKVTSLSLMMGKWRSRGFAARGRVKGAIDRTLSKSHEIVMDSKRQLLTAEPPRIRDILGVR